MGKCSKDSKESNFYIHDYLLGGGKQKASRETIRN